MARKPHKKHGKHRGLLKHFINKNRPDPKAPLGQGGRFAAVEASAAKSGVKDPAAVAAAVGRKKYGAKRFAALSKKGR